MSDAPGGGMDLTEGERPEVQKPEAERPKVKQSEADLTWIFGYGSLIWRPGFSFVRKVPARLEGYRRAFCRYSFRHRGTPERPGLVVGLREGGFCEGMAFAVTSGEEGEALEYLDEREGGGYVRKRVPVVLSSTGVLSPAEVGGGSLPEDDRTEDDPTEHDRKGNAIGLVHAWTYIPNPGHPSYFGEEDSERLVELVATGKGESGTALDYLRNLVEHLLPLNAVEPDLVQVLKAAEAYGD